MEDRCNAHPKIEAVTQCTHCKAPLCGRCLVYFEGTIFCSMNCAKLRRDLGEEIRNYPVSVKRRNRAIRRAIGMAIGAAMVLVVLELLGVTALISFIDPIGP